MARRKGTRLKLIDIRRNKHDNFFRKIYKRPGAGSVYRKAFLKKRGNTILEYQIPKFIGPRKQRHRKIGPRRSNKKY